MELSQLDFKKVMALVLIILGIFPFHTLYRLCCMRRGAAPLRGKYMALYLVVSILFVYIGLRLLLDKKGIKKKDRKNPHS